MYGVGGLNLVLSEAQSDGLKIKVLLELALTQDSEDLHRSCQQHPVLGA